MFQPHPLKADYERALDEIEATINYLKTPVHRNWAWNECMDPLMEIMRSDPPPSAALWNEALNVQRLIDRIQRSKRCEFALVDRIRTRLQDARRVCHYPAQ